MAIGQSNMFSAPGSQGLGGNQQLAGVAQPTGSSDMLNPSLPLGQSFNQMQQSQMQMPQFGGIGSLAPGLGGGGVFPSFQPPRIGGPPGFQPPGIGGPPSFQPPGGFPTAPDMRFTPPWERPGFQPPGIGGPPSFQFPGSFADLLRAQRFDKTSIPDKYVRDRIAGIEGGLGGLGGLADVPPASLIGNLPMFGNTPMPAVTDEVG